MVRRAASFLVRNGPVTQQDRWEEDGGYAPFTLAVEIAALLAAADFADAAGDPEMARYLCETADAWNDQIERWTYCAGTDLARQMGVAGYYSPPITFRSRWGCRLKLSRRIRCVRRGSGHPRARRARALVGAGPGGADRHGDRGDHVRLTGDYRPGAAVPDRLLGDRHRRVRDRRGDPAAQAYRG
jgi:hypothetical protein